MTLIALALLAVVAAGLVLEARRPRAAGATQGMPEPSGRPVDPVGRLVHALRRHRWLRGALSLLSIGLLAGAIGVLGYPLYTNVYQGRVQDRLDRQLLSPELQQAYQADQVEVGDSLTRLQIPAIDVDVIVVSGTTASALRAGAGHYRDSALPCEPGNVAIAGHRTTYGRPFHNLDRLRPGDTIVLTTPVSTCTYTVARNPFIVEPTDVAVVDPTPDARLTLTTCHPKGSAAQRLILQAALQGPATAT